MPDNKAIYRNLKGALDQKGRPKAEVLALASLPTEPPQVFLTRTRQAMRRLRENLNAGDNEIAKESMHLVSIAVDYELEANKTLIPYFKLGSRVLIDKNKALEALEAATGRGTK